MNKKGIYPEKLLYSNIFGKNILDESSNYTHQYPYIITMSTLTKTIATWTSRIQGYAVNVNYGEVNIVTDLTLLVIDIYHGLSRKYKSGFLR